MRKAQVRRNWGLFRFGLALLAVQLASAASAQDAPSLKPAVSANASDLDRLKELKAAIDKRDWVRAKALASQIESPIAQSIGRWKYFYAEDPLVSLDEADAFLDQHASWPALGRIQAHVEKRIPNSASARSVLTFYETRDPISGEGMLQLARAEFGVGRADAGEVYIREAWKRFNFTLADEQQLLANYGRLLTPGDHIARVDRLLWNREATAARRVFARLPAREKRMAEARAALLLGAEDGPKLFDALPTDERLDSGVLHAAVRYYRRREEEPRAVALALQAPSDPLLLRDPVRWWEERQLLMRWALEERIYPDAYVMAAGHGLDPGTQFAEAEFNAGWIALRFMNAPARAETHFAALAGAVGAPISLSRAFYWLGRASEAKGEAQIADRRYADAARYIYTYYGQLAAERRGGAALQQTFAPPTSPTPDDRARFAARPVAQALNVLADLGDEATFLVFSYHLDDLLETPGEYVELARVASRIGATHATVRAGKVGVGRNAFAAEVVYPLIHVPQQARQYAPAEIILGLSRQESEFNPRAYSSAGARGVMQLLPSTAEITARKEGLTYSRTRLLGDADYNMVIGSAHLSHLFARFNSSRVLTFVGYNAGPHRADQWIEKFGDPRSAQIDPVDWIELIPFAETRNYVQRVLENTQVYRGRLTAAPIAGKLAADIEIGGAPNRAGQLPAKQFAGTLPPLPERTGKFADAAMKSVLAPPAPPAPPAPATSTPETVGAEAPMVSSAADALSDKDSADFIGDAQPTGAAGSLARGAAASSNPSASIGRRTPTPTPASPKSSVKAPTPAPLLMPLQPKPSTHEGPAPAADSPPQSAAQAADPPVNAREPGCSTYRNYVSKTAREEASASDLNVGMLAELKGGVSCKPEGPTPPPTN